MKTITNLLLAATIIISTPFAFAAKKIDTIGKAEAINKSPEASQVISRKLDDLSIEEETLDNGLKVVVMHLNSNGAVYAGVGYHVGSGDDPRDVVGVSHFLEHMMFKGTKNISGEKLKETIGKYNKYKNAFTDYDITFYCYNCNKAFLDIDLKIEADRMQNLALETSEIEKEKKVIIEERKMRSESDPRTKFMEESAFKCIYLYSNYSYPVIGYLDQIKACDKKALKKHYDKFYNPSNAFVLIVGDITKDEAVAKVKKYFGSIKKGEKVERNRVIDPENTGLSYSIDHASAQISMHDLNLIYKIKREFIDNLKKHLIINIMTSVLAKGQASVLYENIVDKKELAYNIDSFLDIKTCDIGKFSISTVIRENTNSQKIEEEINQIVYDFADKYLTEALFYKEKNKMLNEIDLMQDDLTKMGMFIIEHIINNHGIKDIKKVRSIIDSITLADVKKAAKDIFTKENRIVKIYSHPKAG